MYGTKTCVNNRFLISQDLLDAHSDSVETIVLFLLNEKNSEWLTLKFAIEDGMFQNMKGILAELRFGELFLTNFELLRNSTGNPLINATTKEVEDFICILFVDEDRNPFEKCSVARYLSSDKQAKRYKLN